jgi:hypothetical protein
MRLYHATTEANLASIFTSGLLVEKADPKAQMKAIWLHTPSKSAWAILHTMYRHKVPLSEVIVIPVDITQSKVRRLLRGLWYTNQNIELRRLGFTIPGEQFAANLIIWVA